MGNTVKKFFSLYNDKSKVIKRITVNADSVGKSPLRFDTEQLKEKLVVDVKEGLLLGTVDKEDIVKELIKNIENY